VREQWQHVHSSVAVEARMVFHVPSVNGKGLQYTLLMLCLPSAQ